MGQAVRERRPLRRRPETMARPARVRMRNRNPWTLARRRLFGWKVRLPLATAVSPRHLRTTRSRVDPRSPIAGLPLLKLFRTGADPGSRSLPCRRRSGDSPRVLRSLAQVKPSRSPDCRPTVHLPPKRLAPEKKPVSFTATTGEGFGCAQFASPASPVPTRCDSRTAPTCTHLWISMWTVACGFRRRSLNRTRGIRR